MTGRETLVMFARLKNLPEYQIPELVTASVVSGASGRWGGASAVLAGVAFSLSIGGLF